MHAAAARLRGPGARALVGAHRALPHPVRRGQHPGRQRHHRRAVLPPAAPPDAPRRPQAARRCSRRRAPAPAGEPLADRRPDARLVPGGARRPGRRRSVGRAPAGVLLGQGGLGRPRPPRQPPACPPPSSASSSCSRSRSEQLLDVLERYPNAKDLVWLQEEPENMGPWHFMFHRTHPIARRRATRCGAWPGWSRAARPPARPRSTSRSWPSCWTRRSPASDLSPGARRVPGTKVTQIGAFVPERAGQSQG